MNTYRNLKVMRFPVLALLAIFSVWLVIENAKPSSCTIFTAAQGEAVLFGNNEDWHNPNPMIGFFPPSSAGFGSIHFGHRDSSGQINSVDARIRWRNFGSCPSKNPDHAHRVFQRE